MALEEIIRKIQSETESEIEKILTSAKEEEREILAQAEIEAEKIKNKIIETGERELAAKKQAQITIAKLEARKTLLAEKQKIIAEVYTEVLKRIEKLPDDKYRGLLRNLILKLAAGGEELIVGEKDKSKIDTDFLKDLNRELASRGKKPLKLSLEVRNIPGGFILRLRNSEINVSFPLLIKSLREKTEFQVIKELFGNGSP